MAYLDINNAIGPFSRVTKFKAPGGAFYMFPHNDDHPDGWGKPYVDAGGKPVAPPGTAVSDGGTDPFRKLAWDIDDAKWGVVRKPGDWLYGNIDWRGLPTVTENQTKAVKLSYYGPQTRYFPDGKFVYGSDDKHNEIYVQGLYAGVAPLPVLGAAYYTYTDPNTSQSTEYLAVICKDGLEDVLYLKPKPTPLAPKSMTPEKRSEMMELYNVFTRLDGWREVLRVARVIYDGAECVDADTPWFFNQSGSEAQCIRRFTKDFDNGVKTVTETGCFRFKIVLNSDTNAIFLNQRNLSGFEVKMGADKQSFPHIEANQILYHYSTPQENIYGPDCHVCPQPDTILRNGDNLEVGHYYGVDYIAVTANAFGEYEVAVDYYNDQEIVGTLKYDIDHKVAKYYRYCIDHKVAAWLAQPRPWGKDGAATGNGYSVNNWYDRPLDGRRWTFWSWYDSGGNPTAWVVCYACQLYDQTDPYNINAALATYIGNGEALPPDTLFNSQYQLRELKMSAEVTLRWTHPSNTDPRILYLYTNTTGTKPRFFNTSFALPDDQVVTDRIDFKAQIQHLDMRIPQGPFVVFRAETIKRTQLGVQLVAHPRYDAVDSRSSNYRSDTGTIWSLPWNGYGYPPSYNTVGYKDPVTGDPGNKDGPFDAYHPEGSTVYDITWYGERGYMTESIRYEFIDPFDDPGDTQLVALQEAGEYYYLSNTETLNVDQMRQWNPTGATYSSHQPTSVDLGDYFGPYEHDWRRRDFNWSYEYITYEGYCADKEEVLADGYEPHIQDATHPAVFGDLSWPRMWEMLGEGGADITGGFAWLDDRAVCLSFTYLKGDEEYHPVTKPIEDALKSVEYANYVTGGDLDNAVSPADRFYPIGVE